MTNAVVLLILGAVVFVAFAVVCILVLPERLVKRDTGGRELDSPEQRASAKNAVRTTLVQAIVGLAALTGIAVAWQQLKADQTQLQVERNQLQEQLNLTRQGQVADRFTRAVDQLGSGKFDVQLGGIYALERIANEAKDPKDRTRLVVFEVLTAYVRRHSPRQDPECPPEGPNGYLQELPNRAADVQAAMTVLARGWSQGDPQLDLHEVDLRGAKLTGIDDLWADLTNANLCRADLSGTHLLHKSSLRDANLRKAVLYRTDLADLDENDFLNVDLRGAFSNKGTEWPDGFDWKAAGVNPQ